MELRNGGRRYPNYRKSQSAESLGFRLSEWCMERVQL